jgi:hypothetical protein
MQLILEPTIITEGAKEAAVQLLSPKARGFKPMVLNVNDGRFL